MFGRSDLQQVIRYQDELRRDAAQSRLASQSKPNRKAPKRTRRVLGLRLSFA